MIEEEGTVVEHLSVGLVRVLCQKSSACQHCASLEACSLGDDSRSRLIEAHDPVGVAVGDRVRLSISSRTLLRSSFLLYIVPVIALVIGALLGQTLGAFMAAGPDPNLLAALLGVAFMVGAFLIIKVGSRALPKENYLPKIVGLVAAETTQDTESDNGH